MTVTWSAHLKERYERHARGLDLLFFIAGFLFDIVATRQGVDHALLVAQQLLYLSIIGGILYLELLHAAAEAPPVPTWRDRLWSYRSLPLHFCLGTLMNLYSLFFLMSASFFSSIGFVVLLLTAIGLNESRAVRRMGVDIKVGLYVLCLFCFFSLMFPLAIGHVGPLPSLLAMSTTVLTLGLFFALLRRRLSGAALRRTLLLPGLVTIAIFMSFYVLGYIPPVPLAAKKMGVYHRVERQGDVYTLFRAGPAWKFWQSGDQDFAAAPGDVVYVFVAVFSPARFDDHVFVRWRHRERGRWQDSDRIPIHITGGREGGFRGFTSKENYSPGDWRVSLETSDGREISRLSFTIARVDADPARVLSEETY